MTSRVVYTWSQENRLPSSVGVRVLMNELELHNLLFPPGDARGMKVKRCNKLELIGP